LPNKTFSIRQISFIRIAHSYLAHGAVTRLKHARDCSRRQLFLGQLDIQPKHVVFSRYIK